MSIFLAAASGLLLAASFPKFGHPAFAWIAITPLIVSVALRVSTTTGRRSGAFRLGLVTGFIYFSATLYWVVPTMTTFGGLSTLTGGGVGLLMVAYLALYPGFFAVLVGMAVRQLGVRGVWLSPVFWVVSEWLRSVLMTGFPWVLLGSSQAHVLPVVQLASVTGVFGLSFLVALVGSAAAAVALSRRPAHMWGAVGVGTLLLLIATAGMMRVSSGRLVSSGRVLRVGLVQANIEEGAKWVPEFRQPIIDRYISLSRQTLVRGASLVIWPESSTPFNFEIQSTLAEPVRQLAATTRTPFIVGTDEITREVEHGEAVERIYNSAVLVGADGLTHGTYRKMHLVPFGEYVPLKSLLFFVGPLVRAVSDFSPGTDASVFDLQGDVGGGRVSVAICYESVYPGISREFVARGSQLLAVITNDSWFGPSSAPYQHFDQSVLRAVEEGRYVVRAANTGVSGVIDPYGRVISQTDLFEPAAITEEVRLLDARTIYSRAGDVIVWLSVFVTAWFLVMEWGWRRRGAGMPTPAR